MSLSASSNCPLRISPCDGSSCASPRGLVLFDETYKPLVDEWYHWFSDDEGLRLGQHHER
jgi:hypothetical protein